MAVRRPHERAIGGIPPDAPADPGRFEEAIRAFRNRIPVGHHEFELMNGAAREQAFKLASVAQGRMVQEVWDAIDSAIADGTDFTAFRDQVEELLTDSWGGEDAPRMETIFRTEIMCVLPGQVIEGRVLAASKSRYSGKVIQLRTKTGRCLTVTPNHPVLTPGGFVGAQHLRHGDHVLRGTGNVKDRSGLLGIKEDKQNGPAAIEDIFESFRRPQGRLMRRSLDGLDLHGDAKGTDGKIDVVRTKRKLLIDAEAKFSQRIRKIIFPSSMRHRGRTESGDSKFSRQFRLNRPTAPPVPGFGHRRIDEGLSLCGRFTIPGGPFRLGYSSRPKANRSEKPRYLPRSDADLIGDFQNRLSSAVAIKNSLLNMLRQRDFQAARFGAAAQIDASVFKPAGYRGRADADLFRQLLCGASGLVARDEILDIGHGDFSGYVFDIQASGGWYQSEQIYISNCSYNQGRDEVFSDPVVREARPFTRFDIAGDDRTCEICEPLEGLVLEADSSFWDDHKPPLHPNCRCLLVPLSPDEAEEAGVDTEAPESESPTDGFGDGSPYDPDLDSFSSEIADALRERLDTGD